MMLWLWNGVKANISNENWREKIFLTVNVILYFAIGFIVFFLCGLLVWQAGMKLLEYALIAAGYAAVFVGFLGGCIFLMRNTPE